MAATSQRIPATAATSSKAQNSGAAMQQNAAPSTVSVNRKKAKRRAKQAAKQSVNHDLVEGDDFESDSAPSPNGRLPQSQDFLDPQYSNPAYASHGDPGDFAYSDEENEYSYDPGSHIANGGSVEYASDAGQIRTKGKKKKRRDGSAGFDGIHDDTHRMPGAPQQPSYNHRSTNSLAPRAISDDALRTVQRGINNGIWNTSSVEERSSIKHYWLNLGEDERKALVKIEKNDVLKKMKDQQKHSCSCTVCGRKRVAIEEELEVLYDAYYQELEQYANHNQHLSENGTPMLPPPRRYSTNSLNRPPSNGLSAAHRHRSRGRVINEVQDDEQEDEVDEEDDEEFSEEEYDEDEYSVDDRDSMRDSMPPTASEFFTFGKSLTVKGGILTVADDLLKNDGQKFIDMMEQLAERRMQREEQAGYTPYPSHPSAPPQHTHADHSHLPQEEEEYDDEEDEDYASEDEDYEEEDDVDTMTEGQRMDEGRRMFQIFAARMFEQRVLTAYREQLAKERTEQFLRDLDAEKQAKSDAVAKNAAKKAKQKAKEKAKKDAVKEEKQRKADEKAAAEREEEERKQEEKRKRDEDNRRKEEERKRKQEAVRRAQEDEKLRKKAEEREREEARKAREQKIKEKKEKEDSARKEREYEEREKKAQQEREERDKQEQARLDKAAQEAKRRMEQAAQASRTQAAADIPQHLDSPRRAPIPAVVALPPGLKSKPSFVGHESPLTKIATPTVPKPPTPVRAKEVVSRISSSSTPATPETGPHSKQPSPANKTPAQHNGHQPSLMPATRASGQHMPPPNAPPLPAVHSIAPPPGMHHQQGNNHLGMPQMVANGFPGVPGPMMPGMMQHRMPLGHQMPMYPHGPHMGLPPRGFMHPAGGIPPPGINPSQMPQPVRGFNPDHNVHHPQHLQTSLPGNTQPSYATTRETLPLPHSRQASMSFDATPPEPQTPISATQPIARPAPIKRPASVKPPDGSAERFKKAGSDVDELSTRLGSSALLDDNDEPLPITSTDNRRTSGPLGSSLPKSAGPGLMGSPYDQMQTPFGSMGAPGDRWRTPSSHYNASNISSGWAQSPSTNGWGKSVPYSIPTHHRPSVPRPVTVRVLACKALNNLAFQGAGLDEGFYDFNDVMRMVQDIAHQQQETIPTPNELRDILDTEGDAHNGGGTFAIRQDNVRRTVQVRWHSNIPDMFPGRHGMGVGEIGSPLPSHKLPALGGLGSGRGF